VIGMLIRWMSTSVRPIANGANPTGARASMTLRMMKMKNNVRISSARNPDPSV